MATERAPARARRRDAENNRTAVLEAAAQVFAERGAGVDVREIARAAGVGMGTLYRHFPTKESLIEAVLADTQERWARTTEELLALDDPWLALTRFMEDTLSRHAAHRGLLESFSTCFSTLTTGVYGRSVEPVITELITRSRARKMIRDDVTADDIALLLIAVGRTIEVTENTAPGTWRRTLDVVLDGLRA